MKLAFTMVVFALMALLEGCAQENVKQSLENLSKDCDRHYTFNISTGGVGGIGANAMVSGTADCKHEYGVAPAPVTNP